MKKLLSLLIMSFVIMSLGVVSADLGVNFTSPIADADISNGLLVSWDNTDSVPGLYLQYAEDGCEAGTWIDLNDGNDFGGSETEYLWNTNEVNDGKYCLRLYGISLDYAISGNFTIDNKNPTAVISKPLPTDEFIVYEKIKFKSTGSNDGTGSGIKSYSWDFDEDGIEDSNKTNPRHFFTEPKTYDVTLTVTDYAGNSGEASLEIEVEDFPVEDCDLELEDQEILQGELLEYTFLSGYNNLEECKIMAPRPNGGMNLVEVTNNCSFDWEPTNKWNSMEGPTNVVIKITNKLDEVKYCAFDITVYTWKVELKEGLNLVSIPLIPGSTDIDDVLGGIEDNINKVWSWQYSDGIVEGKSARPCKTKSGFCEDTIEDIKPGYGYIIDIKEDAVFTGFGNEPSLLGLPDTIIELGDNDFNMIGKFGLEPVLKSEEKQNLRFSDVIKNLADSLLFRQKELGVDDIKRVKKADLLEPTQGFWILTRPNNGNSIGYTFSNKDKFL